MNSSFTFIIDTENYAGNFERKMCAFCTGQIGECEVGENEADRFNEEVEGNPFEDKVYSRPDDNGCRRPVAILETPGWFNNGFGGRFKEGQEEESLIHRNEEYKKNGKHEMCDTLLQKYPAHLSVGIFFNEQPTEEELNLMMERAKVFAIVITGFRLLQEITSVEEIWSK